MKSSLGFSLLALAVVYVGLSFLIQNLYPEIARTTFITGLVGGGLSALWGLLALLGLRSRAWAILTLVATSFVFLSQMVTAWMEAGRPLAATIITVMLLLSLGMIMFLAYTGQITDGATDTSQTPSVGGQRRK